MRAEDCEAELRDKLGVVLFSDPIDGQRPEHSNGVFFNSDRSISEALSILAKMEGIQSLSLPAADDETLGILVRFRDLRKLAISQSQATAQGYRSLSFCKSLAELELKSPVTVEIAREIARIESLRSLRLGDMLEGDDCVRKLASLPRLANLDLWGCAITDRGMSFLKGHPVLQSIGLVETLVRDAGLLTLAEVPSLRRVMVSARAFSATAVALFRQLAPSVELEELRSLAPGEGFLLKPLEDDAEPYEGDFDLNKAKRLGPTD